MAAIQGQKQSGAFYTPQLLADYVVYRLFKEGGYSFDREIDVLEPSVGGGFFLDSLLDGNHFKAVDKDPLRQKDIPYMNITAVEIDESAVGRLRQKKQKYDSHHSGIAVKHNDYLKIFLQSRKKYDLIIGNPPYVRRRNMSPETRELCAKVHQVAGLHDEKPKNLWTAFFAAAKCSLKDKGVIAFVLPTDLLQVKYPEQIREILNKEFDRVELFMLNWSAFREYDEVEQDVVILFCSNGHGETDEPQFFHIESEKELEEPKHHQDFNNSSRQNLNKWTNYVLSPEEFAFLDDIHHRVLLKQVKEFCDSGAGIVSAANDYFIVDKETRDKYKLQDVAKPTIKKSSSMFPASILTRDDIEKRSDEGAELYFIDLNMPKNELSASYLRYIERGESEGLHLRYKMLLRDDWYVVPSVWKSEGFFTKRSNIFPRIIINEADAYVTDAFYRIRMKDGYSIDKLAFSFFNTLTFIYCELSGRYYGGGVLELTPNEFKGVDIPYLNMVTYEHVKKLDQMQRNKVGLEEILNFTDALLIEPYGILRKEIDELRRIYEKLLSRRLKRPYNLKENKK